MVDISRKPVSVRTAVAESVVPISPRLRRALASRRRGVGAGKGDPVSVAVLAGILAAKKTSDLIPLCHPIRLDHVSVDPIQSRDSIRFVVTCVTSDRTGIEMEAMTGAAVAALAFYDMVKSVERGVTIRRVRLLKKTGGASGTYLAARA